MKNIRVAALLVSVGLLSVGHTAIAATATANLEVSATVNSSCTIQTSPLAFGTYDPAATSPTDATGQVTIACVKGSVPVISLGAGLHSADTAARKMATASGTDSLNYFLYKPDADGTSCSLAQPAVWGNQDTERLSLAAVQSINPTAYSVCGRITAGQDVPAGTYQDTVTATVEF